MFLVIQFTWKWTWTDTGFLHRKLKETEELYVRNLKMTFFLLEYVPPQTIQPTQN